MANIQVADYRERNLAGKFLLGILTVICGLIAAFLGLTFELKIVLGLLSGLLFGTIIILRPFVGIIFLLVATPALTVFPPTFFGSGLLNPQNLVVAWVAISIALQRAIVQRTGPNPWSTWYPALGFFGALLMSLVLHVVNGYGDVASFLNFARTYLFGYMIFYLTANVINTDAQARKVFWAVIVMVTLVSLWGLFEYRQAVVSGQDINRIRISGRVGQPNEFGAFLAMYLPFLVAAVRLRSTSTVARLCVIVGVVACFFALLFTQSRGAYVGLLTFVILTALLINRRLIFLLIIGAVTGPYWLPSQVVDRVTNTFVDGGRQFDKSAESRLMYWEAGFDMFKDSPIYGHGFKGFNELVYRRGVTNRQRASHSLYVQMMSEAGLIGIVSVIVLFGAFVRISWRLRHESEDPFVRLFAEGFVGCMLAVIVVNVFGVRFYNYGTVSYFWALAAVLLRCNYIHQREMKARAREALDREREEVRRARRTPELTAVSRGSSM